MLCEEFSNPGPISNNSKLVCNKLQQKWVEQHVIVAKIFRDRLELLKTRKSELKQENLQIDKEIKIVQSHLNMYLKDDVVRVRVESEVKLGVRRGRSTDDEIVAELEKDWPAKPELKVEDLDF